MSISHEVTLTLSSGLRLDVWDEYRVEIDMLKAGSPYSFTLYRSDTAQSAWGVLLDNIKCGLSVVLAIDGAPQLNGRIENIALSRRNRESVTISGRDLAGVPMSWNADPRQVATHGQTLGDTLTRLFQPLGIPVVVGADADVSREVQGNIRRSRRGSRSRGPSQVVQKFRPKIGEKVWPLAEKLCRRHGLLLWVAPDTTGQLAVIVDKPAYDSPAIYNFLYEEIDGLTTSASNVLTSDYRIQIADTPTEIFMYGRGGHGDNTGPRICSHVKNERFHPRFVARPLPFQPRHMKPERASTPAGIEQEAERVVSDAMAHHAVYTCAVQGHGQEIDGQIRLFAINSMCHVKDTDWGIDEDMLLSKVVFNRSVEQGTTTECTLHRKDALKVNPE